MTPEHLNGGMEYEIKLHKTKESVCCDEFHLTDNPSNWERILLCSINDDDVNEQFDIEMTLDGGNVDGYPCIKTADSTKTGELHLCKLWSGKITVKGWTMHKYDTAIGL